MSGFLGAVVAPSTPLLLPGVGGTRGGDDVADVRDRMIAELGALQQLSPSRWVVVGGAATVVGDAAGACGTRVAGGGVPGAGVDAVTAAVAPWPSRTTAAPAALPLSLAVGRHLLSAAGIDGGVDLVAVAFDASPQTCLDLGRELAADGTALLVVGDGAARRTRQSPGDFDERAETYDDAIEKALAEGDPAGLAALDPELAAELMVGGRAALQVLAGTFAGRRTTASAAGLLATAPLGLRYWVTSWT